MAAPVPESEHTILPAQEGGGHEAPHHTHRMHGRHIQINPLPDGGTELVFLGHNIVGNPEAGFLVLTIGRFNAIFDAEGGLVQDLEGSGQRIDICALLS